MVMIFAMMVVLIVVGLVICKKIRKKCHDTSGLWYVIIVVVVLVDTVCEALMVMVITFGLEVMKLMVEVKSNGIEIVISGSSEL